MIRPDSFKSIISFIVFLMILITPLTSFYSNSEGSILEDKFEKRLTHGALNTPGFTTGSIFTNSTISVGAEYACLAQHIGGAKCWGAGNQGKLGNGGTGNQNTPVSVNNLGSIHIEEIEAGAYGTCARTNQGEVYCWGGGYYGQLGTGVDEQSENNLPDLVLFPENTSALTIAAANYAVHKCAILNNSETFCWGANDNGQLGDGTQCQGSSSTCNINNGKFTPVAVNLPANKSATSMALGHGFTCAVMSDHTVYCWGLNNNNQLGLGSEDIRRLNPSQVFLDNNVGAVAIAAGYSSACALLLDQTIECWGTGEQGELGNNATTSQSTPSSLFLDSGDNPISITMGTWHGCMLLDTMKAKCWGDNYWGNLGNNGSVVVDHEDELIPVDVFGNHSFVGIDAGSSNTCALKENGTVYCWGSNNYGANGNSESIIWNGRSYPLPINGNIAADISERDLDNDGIISIFDANPYLCEVGFYKVDDICVETPAGTYSDDGEQIPCPVGTYQPQTGQSSCLLTSPGNFVNTTNSIAEIPCFAGTYQPDSGQASCLQNTPGNYTLEGASNQEGCSVGTYQPSSSGTTCISAAPGYFVNLVMSDSQTACPAGTYQQYSSQNTCYSASLGYYVNSSASINQVMCDMGTYSDTQGQIECTPASLGYFVSDIGQSSEIACSPGEYQPQTGTTSCLITSPGHYTNSNGAPSEIPCPAGKYQPSAGQASCINAELGSYVPDQGAQQSSLCLAGTYSSQLGQDECTPAEPGSFVSTDGASITTPCSSGQFQEDGGSVSCENTPSGYFTNSDGASEISPCQPGTYAPSGQSSCIEAPPGTYVNTKAQSEYQLCNQGTFQPNSGQSSCLSSTPGNHVPKYASTEETPCDIGTFQPDNKQTNCIDSNAGQYVPSEGRSYQTPCQKGTYQPVPGQEDCLMADPGNFVSSQGASQQFPCSPGNYQPSGGMSKCENADIDNYVSESESTEQTPCPSGDNQPSTGQLRCIEGPKSITDYIPFLVIPVLIVGAALFYKYRNQGKNTVTKKTNKGKWGEKSIDYVPKTINRKRK